MPDNLTRKDLYDLVWSKPMVEIAKEYGFSDRGLAKLCKRNSIPVPSRGYWAKKQAGKKVSKAPFLALEDKASETQILIRKATFVKSPLKEKAEENTSVIPEPIQQAMEQEKLSQNEIKVPKTLHNPHPIVKVWIKSAEDELERSRRYPNFNWAEPITALDRRKWRLCSALFGALEKRGFKISEIVERGLPKQVWIGFEGDNISYDMSEYVRQYRRQLTEEEKKNRPHTKQKWNQERIKTGRLKITLSPENTPYSNTTIHEDESKPFENSLNEVTAKIIEVVWETKKRRLEQQERDHRRWEEAKRQQELQELKEKEEKRKINLVYKAYAWKEAQIIREYVVAVETSKISSSNGVVDEAFTAWKNWALAYADKIDYISNGNPLVDLESDPENLRIDYDSGKGSAYPSLNSYGSDGHPWKKWYHR